MTHDPYDDGPHEHPNLLAGGQGRDAEDVRSDATAWAWSVAVFVVILSAAWAAAVLS